ncbi:ATP-binding protein [Quatrionicoccus australiensis]|uniref:ATP-binding protein n=1 Tax=Quatrionicoccus australiensis TaxID=138118 RepID=UPI001CF86878|nr:ATP-binding protein [Quatrionicoccus australiensis]UCV15029.1 response regulator [Quatrionicoccus australiensis]
MMHFLPLRTVRGKLLLLAIAVEALMLTLLVANSLRLLTDNMGTQARIHAEQIAPVLIAAIVAPLAQRDYATVQAVLDESSAVDGIDYLAVTDISGKRLASSGWPADQELPLPDKEFHLFDNEKASPRYDVMIPVDAYGQKLAILHFGLSLKQIIQAHGQLFKQGVGIALLEIILSAGLMALLGYFLTRHLSALTVASRAVAAGNLTPPPVPEGDDEVGHLGATFNAMSRAIAERIRELTEARDEEKRLAQAAEAGAREKTAFLATVSHEIRTPMNGILGMTDLALSTELTAEQREYLTWVKLSGESLMRVLNDILDFSKIDAGQLSLEKVPLNLPAMLDSMVGIYSAQASEKGLTLSWQAAPDLPAQIVSDPVRLRQILSNLVANALKFTEHGSVSIRVSAEPLATVDALKLHFSVVDTGIGIPSDKLEMIFAPFSQAESSTTRKYGGTGLGLAIVSRLVKLLGGEINVVSQPGQGSTFSFSINCRMSETPHARASAPASTPVPDNSLAGKKILLVEDTPVNQILGRKLLAKFGCEVTLAEDGLQALAACATADFDLALMDMQMPNMDGLEATRQLRARERESGRPRLPIIALTANAMSADRDNCLAAGMDDFIAKPFRADSMLEVIRRHCLPENPA